MAGIEEQHFGPIMVMLSVFSTLLHSSSYFAIKKRLWVASKVWLPHAESVLFIE